MQKEINKAVDIFHRIAFGTKNNTKKLSEAKLTAFISILSELLKARYEKNWYPDNPDRGSGYRCIRVNSQSIDPTIVESLKRAKIAITKDLIITELTIWVDPGVVSVRIGEDGSIGSEVVDEEVYNIGIQTKEMALKRSGLESDEGFSSRSSSPESSISDNSRSTSPSTSPSPIPSVSSVSPAPPALEYNPYSPHHFSYSSIYQRPSTPLAPHQQQRNPSPISNQLQHHTVRSQSRSMIPLGPTMMSASNRDMFSQTGYIPSSAAHQVATYSRPRALFSNQDNISTCGQSHDGLSKVAFNSYHTVPAMYGGSFHQTNIYDIPAVA